MIKHRIIIPLLFGLIACLTTQANANIVSGNFLGVFSGNDSEIELETLFAGNTFTQLAKVETPATSNNGLNLTNISVNGDNEPVSGNWSYSGSDLVDFLIVKAGNSFAVYKYTDANTDNMRNIGLWDTSALNNKGMSHISAYRVSAVPIPAAVWLFGAGLLGLFRIKKILIST